MSTVQVEVPPQVGAPADGARGEWRVSWHGLRTVVTLELRQRVRSTRWIVALVVWFVVVGGLTLLTTGAMSIGSTSGTGWRGPILFGVVTALVLGLGLVVTPTLASTAINGDRAAGTLATLQVTLLTPAEIALGKLLAAWFAALAFLVVSVPFFGLALAMGHTPVRSAFAVLGLIALLLAAVCGMGLGWSALSSRTAGSTVLTFVTVTGLTVFTPILFALTYPSIQEERPVQVWTDPSNTSDGTTDPQCEWVTETRPVSHTERTWWLLALNPFVVVADGSGVPDDADYPSPYSSIRDGVRQLRAGADVPINECWGMSKQIEPPGGMPNPSSTPIWPWGLAGNLLLGAGGVVVAVRRLRIPQRTLPRGTRVA